MDFDISVTKQTHQTHQHSLLDMSHLLVELTKINDKVYSLPIKQMYKGIFLWFFYCLESIVCPYFFFLDSLILYFILLYLQGNRWSSRAFHYGERFRLGIWNDRKVANQKIIRKSIKDLSYQAGQIF